MKPKTREKTTIQLEDTQRAILTAISKELRHGPQPKKVAGRVAGRVAGIKLWIIHLSPCRFLILDDLPPALLYRVVEVVRVELGELLCDSLSNVADSTLLRIAISSNEVRDEDPGTLAFDTSGYTRCM